jgi:hypothetical protein
LISDRASYISELLLFLESEGSEISSLRLFSYLTLTSSTISILTSDRSFGSSSLLSVGILKLAVLKSLLPKD